MGSPTDPAPVGTPFTYSASYSETEWTGTVLGLVEMARSDFGEGGPGRCLGIVGTLTPTVVEGLTSDGFSTPEMTVIAGGRVADRSEGLFECEYQSVEEAGFGLAHDAAVTVGTAYPFVVPVFLSGEPAPEPELIAVGDTGSNEAMYYQPTVLTALPPVPAGPDTVLQPDSSAAPSDTPLTGAGTSADPAPVGTPFEFTESFSESSWTGTVLGIVELERSEFGGGSPGRCVGVIGTLTPTAMEGLTSESFTAPNIAVIAGGGVVDSLDSLFECDYQAVVDVGFGLTQDAAVTVDTVYPFVVPVFLPGETPTVPELVAVGNPSSADAMYYQPTPLPALPPLPQ